MEREPSQELVERIERLEAEVRHLIADRAGATEVRARRLVIVDELGDERVVIETVAGTSSVLVRVPGPAGNTTGIELFATPADGATVATVGVCVLRAGDVVEQWSAR